MHRLRTFLAGSLLALTFGLLCNPSRAAPVAAQAADAVLPPVAPQYSTLKPLHRETDLIVDGRPNAVIVIPADGRYRADAQAIQSALHNAGGATVPIALDSDASATIPFAGNLILLGNRSTNQTVSKLYDLFYTLTDLKYPGNGGYEVRTLHNPFGNGFNAVLVGGSDDAGVAAGAAVLAGKLRQSKAAGGTLSLGWQMEIKLGDGVVVPPTPTTASLRNFPIWEASPSYGSTGYFGWNSISKRLALYYMTGDPFQAREALRLAFPDVKAKQELFDVDGEMIENKDDPLAGPYHYGATMMILFWNLVEDSPVFNDSERLKVTNAFARQIEHGVHDYPMKNVYNLTRPGANGDRHQQYAALSLYCLARYFDRDYPDAMWRHALQAAQFAFAPEGMADSFSSGDGSTLFWFSTGIAPDLTYALLSGDRRGMETGVIPRLLADDEMLLNGRISNDPNIASLSLDLCDKAAYLTGNGCWLTYRDRTGMDTNCFRLGQSFWPPPTLAPALPTYLVGHWTVRRPSATEIAMGAGGFPPEESFKDASFRSTGGGNGDFILVDGRNGMGRNDYYAYALLALRIDGQTLLDGFCNQVRTKADGMVEPTLAYDAALRGADALGQSAIVVADVPKATFCDWQRTLVQRVGRYALVVDELTPRVDSDHFEAQFLWEKTGKHWQPGPHAGELELGTPGGKTLPPGAMYLDALAAQSSSNLSSGVLPLPEFSILLLRGAGVGDWLDMTFTLARPWRGRAEAWLLNSGDRGIVAASLDGQPAGAVYDGYCAQIESGKIDLGDQELGTGTHHLRLEVRGKNTLSTGFLVGLSGLELTAAAGTSQAQSAQGVSPVTISSADPLTAELSVAPARQVWRGPVRQGEHYHFFTLLRDAGPDVQAVCARLAPNATALRLPEPAVAEVGTYAGNTGDLVLLGSDHLFGRNLTSAGLDHPLLTSDAPVQVDWDFGSGRLEIENDRPVRLILALASDAHLADAHGAVPVTGEAGATLLQLDAGRHSIGGALPAPALRVALQGGLAGLVETAVNQPAVGAGTTQANGMAAAPPLTTRFSKPLGSPVAAYAVAGNGAAQRVYAATGNTIHVFNGAGRALATMKTDAPVDRLHWWPEHKLLLAGCQDYKVIAFDESGARRWTFVSEMDPAVLEAGKPYWFRPAPASGKTVVHGLDSGVFLDGRSQAFVGSACTVEIVDENGALVKRLPYFWGFVNQFVLVPGNGGTTNLLVGSDIGGVASLHVVNSATLDPSPSGFYNLPPGYTETGGWQSMTRMGEFHLDVDGDGKRELVSAITGIGNRVTVWDDSTGNPKYDANFGPGPSAVANWQIQPTLIRGIDVACIGSDALPQIVVALDSGLVLGLDGHCRKLWSQQLDIVPTYLKIVGRAIVVGGDKGEVVALADGGAVVGRGHVDGSVTSLDSLNDGEVMAIGGNGIKAFGLP